MEHSKGRPATQIEVEAFTAIANLQDENRELKERLYNLIKVCETIQPFITQKYLVTEIKAAVKLAKGNPSPASRSQTEQVTK